MDEAYSWAVEYSDGSTYYEDEALVCSGPFQGWKSVRLEDVRFLFLLPHDGEGYPYWTQIRPGKVPFFTRRVQIIARMGDDEDTVEVIKRTALTIYGQRDPDGSNGEYVFISSNGAVRTSDDLEAYQE